MMIESTPLGRIVIPPHVPPGFALFYTTRDIDGRLGGEKARAIGSFIKDRFGIDARLNTCVQVHGVSVERAHRAGAWRECDSCDALWSDEKSVALGIKVADCLPVTMIDPVHYVIANVHSGWRGAAQGITAAMLDTLANETLFDASQARVWLGPSIRVCCFEVGEEVATQFDAKYADRTRGAKPHLDLPALTRDLLLARGFAGAAIIDTELCTRCEGSIFHSYRRDGKGGGRNLAIAAQ
jgi:YfiH family protein